MIAGTRYRLTMEINRQQRLAADIERMQTQISTTKRIQAASDDPGAAARVSEIARSQANEAAWKTNLDTAAALAARADTELAGLDALMIRASELMVAAANGTMSEDNRSTFALELRSIAEEIATIEARKDSRGQPLFPTGAAVAIPVGEGLTIVPVTTREAIFTADVGGAPQALGDIVAAAAAALEEPDPAARAAAIGASLEAVNAGTAHVATMRGEQGARANRIDNMLESLANSKLQLSEERSGLEDTDVVETIAKLQARQLTLQAAQAVFARVNQNTLFDILR